MNKLSIHKLIGVNKISRSISYKGISIVPKVTTIRGIYEYNNNSTHTKHPSY
jgi:hypothetical protein